MTDEELNKIRKEVEESDVGCGDYYYDGWVKVSLAKTLLDEVDRLKMDLAGTEKARLLLMTGMESQCELMDSLKQEIRLMRDGRQ